MGFKIYYRSTQRVSIAHANAIRKAAEELSEGRTWLSCEPVGFYADRQDGRLAGGSKPNFLPHPDDVAAAASESLPDGTLRDVIEVLCQLSRDHGVDWQFSHDYDPGPIGFIRDGVCDADVLVQAEAFADLASDVLAEAEALLDPFPPSISGISHDGIDTEGPDEDEDGPQILPFEPRSS